MSTKIQGSPTVTHALATARATTPAQTAPRQAPAAQTQVGFSAQSSFEPGPAGGSASSSSSTQPKSSAEQQQAILKELGEKLDNAETSEEAIKVTQEALQQLEKHSSGVQYAGKLSLAGLTHAGLDKSLPLDELKKRLAGIVRFAPMKAGARRAFFNQLLEQAQSMYKRS